jgi:hypothetical protein
MEVIYAAVIAAGATIIASAIGALISRRKRKAPPQIDALKLQIELSLEEVLKELEDEELKEIGRYFIGADSETSLLKCLYRIESYNEKYPEQLEGYLLKERIVAARESMKAREAISHKRFSIVNKWGPLRCSNIASGLTKSLLALLKGVLSLTRQPQSWLRGANRNALSL